MVMMMMMIQMMKGGMEERNKEREGYVEKRKKNQNK